MWQNLYPEDADADVNDDDDDDLWHDAPDDGWARPQKRYPFFTEDERMYFEGGALPISLDEYIDVIVTEGTHLQQRVALMNLFAQRFDSLMERSRMIRHHRAH